MTRSNSHIIQHLQADILKLQGFKPANSKSIDLGLGEISECFPNKSFPLGAVHEFVSSDDQSFAVSASFISGLIAPLIQDGKVVLWVTCGHPIFPAAIRGFGIQPHRIVFIDLKKESDVVWVLDEALKCSALTVVVGELHNLDFKLSRRFQLAVEESKVTGLMLRRKEKNISTTACVSRWKITSLPSQTIDSLPGIGYPAWKVELLRVKNGKTGSWNIIWRNGKFEHFGKLQIAGFENLKVKYI
jgi:protein ImuA